jgi:hypothetical protein
VEPSEEIRRVVDRWLTAIRAGLRTLARLFLAETGMCRGDRRRQA